MSSHTQVPTNGIRSSPAVAAELILYRFAEKLVYVKPADTYEQGLAIALHEYPELTQVPPDRIEFVVKAIVEKEHRFVRISKSGWYPAIARQMRGDVIDIFVRSEPDDKAAAPPYHLTVPAASDEFPRSRSASSSPRPHVRKLSPSAKSEGGKSEKTASWFGK